MAKKKDQKVVEHIYLSIGKAVIDSKGSLSFVFHDIAQAVEDCENGMEVCRAVQDAVNRGEEVETLFDAVTISRQFNQEDVKNLAQAVGDASHGIIFMLVDPKYAAGLRHEQ